MSRKNFRMQRGQRKSEMKKIKQKNQQCIVIYMNEDAMMKHIILYANLKFYFKN